MNKIKLPRSKGIQQEFDENNEFVFYLYNLIHCVTFGKYAKRITDKIPILLGINTIKQTELKWEGMQ